MQVDLVPDSPYRRSLQLWSFVPLRIAHPQYEVRFRRPRPRPAYTFLLDGIVGLANSGGVDHGHRIAVEIELHLDHVPRGARVRRHDRHLAPRQRIHQRGFADIRRTGDRDHQSLAQPLATSLRRQHILDLAQQHFDLRPRRRDQFGGHVAFIGKIDAGFDQRGGLDDLIAPGARAVAKQSLQLAQCLAALPVGVGVDQIVEAFGLGQVELAILERTPGKLARLRRAQIGKTRQRHDQRRHHRAPAVDLKFRDVLAGRACRTRKPEHHRIVDRLLIRLPQQYAAR